MSLRHTHADMLPLELCQACLKSIKCTFSERAWWVVGLSALTFHWIAVTGCRGNTDWTEYRALMCVWLERLCMCACECVLSGSNCLRLRTAACSIHPCSQNKILTRVNVRAQPANTSVHGCLNKACVFGTGGRKIISAGLKVTCRSRSVFQTFPAVFEDNLILKVWKALTLPQYKSWTSNQTDQMNFWAEILIIGTLAIVRHHDHHDNQTQRKQSINSQRVHIEDCRQPPWRWRIDRKRDLGQMAWMWGTMDQNQEARGDSEVLFRPERGLRPLKLLRWMWVLDGFQQNQRVLPQKGCRQPSWFTTTCLWSRKIILQSINALIHSSNFPKVSF